MEEEEVVMEEELFLDLWYHVLELMILMPPFKLGILHDSMWWTMIP